MKGDGGAHRNHSFSRTVSHVQTKYLYDLVDLVQLRHAELLSLLDCLLVVRVVAVVGRSVGEAHGFFA